MDAPPGTRFKDFDRTSPAGLKFKHIGENRKDYGLPDKPKLIIVISAHWEEDDGAFHVFTNEKQQLYYDYYGFPAPTYQLEYKTPLAPSGTSKRIVDLINATPGLRAVEDETREGFDHGVFLPLMLLYPECECPVVQISLNSNGDLDEHYKLGMALQVLRGEEGGALIVASGEAAHPMRSAPTPETTSKFISLLEDVLLPTENDKLQDIRALLKLPILQQTHNPGREHFTPLFVAMGAATKGTPAKDLFKNAARGQDYRAMGGTFSMASFIFE